MSGGEAPIPIGELRIRPFKDSPRVEGFSCGNRDLDDFLNTDEVEKYEREGLGKTYLVFRRGQLVWFGEGFYRFDRRAMGNLTRTVLKEAEARGVKVKRSVTTKNQRLSSD